MQKFITPVLITLFIACGIYAIADSLFSLKPKEKPTSSLKYDRHLKEVKQEPKENLQAVKKLPYDYKVINSKAVFLPTWNNVFNTVTMPQHLFEDVMAIYNYKYDEKTDNNSWDKQIGTSIFRITREKEGSLLLQWENIKLSTTALEQQLKEELTLVQKDEFIQTYEYKKETSTIRISIAKTKDFNFVAFDIIKN